MKKKVTDIIAEFLESKEIHFAFGVSGGASLHLIHSIHARKNLEHICCHHEQAAAMAADAYARMNRKTGICVSSSGPGATNLITGIACSFYDSVPVIAITGQVSTFRMKGKSKIRQKGFQETPIIEMVKGITKYAIQIKDANEVPRELRKAYEIANDGRKGPVWIDIPDDIQREEIDMEDNWIDIYNNDDNIEMPEGNNRNLEDKIAKTIKMIKEAERPVLVGGWGINISGMRRNSKYSWSS